MALKPLMLGLALSAVLWLLIGLILWGLFA